MDHPVDVQSDSVSLDWGWMIDSSARIFSEEEEEGKGDENPQWGERRFVLHEPEAIPTFHHLGVGFSHQEV